MMGREPSRLDHDPMSTSEHELLVSLSHSPVSIICRAGGAHLSSACFCLTNASRPAAFAARSKSGGVERGTRFGILGGGPAGEMMEGAAAEGVADEDDGANDGRLCADGSMGMIALFVVGAGEMGVRARGRVRSSDSSCSGFLESFATSSLSFLATFLGWMIVVSTCDTILPKRRGQRA